MDALRRGGGRIALTLGVVVALGTVLAQRAAARARSRAGARISAAQRACQRKGRTWRWDPRRRQCKRRCDSSRYGCAGRKPADYDRQVRIIHRPARGQDRACLARLRKAGIRFRMLAGVKGVRTPVEVLSKRLGRVLYRRTWNNKRRFILDCRMVEALAVMGREIRRAGVASIYYASTWRYSYVKNTRRLSKHAYGMAIDITAIDGAFGYATVIRHYEKGVWGCGTRNRTPKGTAWRKFFCALKLRRAFRTVYTPDTDRYHRDHFHVEQPNRRLQLTPRAPRRRR